MVLHEHQSLTQENYVGLGLELIYDIKLTDCS